MLITICADNNNMNEDGNIRLDTFGAIRDIKTLEILLEKGLRVLLSMDDIEAEATIDYDEREKVWVGIPDWSTLRDL